MSTARREREQSSRRVKINVDEAIDVIEVNRILFDVVEVNRMLVDVIEVIRMLFDVIEVNQIFLMSSG